MKYIKMFENFDKGDINTVSELTNKLREHSIPIELWGTGESKTVENLLDEIKTGESYIEDVGDYLIRYIEFIGVTIYYKDVDGNNWILKEDRQEFKDGRSRRRNIGSSVSEKMLTGEDTITSAIRGIKEELNVTITKDQLERTEDVFYDSDSLSYPGLRAKYKGHQFVCHFTHDQFDKRGYIEVQKDKSTFFKWIKKQD